MGDAAEARRDLACVGDEQRAWDAGALAVVLDDHGEGYVGGVVAEAGEGRHGDAVGEADVFEDLEGLEELRGACCRFWHAGCVQSTTVGDLAPETTINERKSEQVYMSSPRSRLYVMAAT